MSSNADIQISAISTEKMFADSRYADIEKKCRYADIADVDINIGTSLQNSEYILSIAQNYLTGLALDRKVCEPWEKLDKYLDVLRMASYPLSFSKWFRHSSTCFER